jgi:hypothetical protein
MPRFVVISDKTADHQIFGSATVVDTARPYLDGSGAQMMLGENDDEPQWTAVCEAASVEDAEMIAAALNAFAL